jgi:two-component system cell cycle sensor histidine kinase/response regulator CckA
MVVQDGQRVTRVVERASRAIQSAAGYERILSVALDSVVPGLADFAVLMLGEESGGTRIEAIHRHTGSTSRLRHDVGAALDAVSHAASAQVKAGHHSRWLPSVTEASVRSLIHGDERLAALLGGLGVRSLIVVALRSGGRTLGGLGLARTETQQPFTPDEFAASKVLASRIAVGLESAVLQESLRSEIRQRPTIGEALTRWVRVFDLAWWGAAVVDGVDRRIDTVNPAFARLHGYADPAALRGRLYSELLPDDRAAEPEAWGGDRQEQPYETVHRKSDGGTIPVLVSVTPLETEGRRDSYVVTVQDLTDIKRTEERLRRAQRMEAVGRLAGGVAHEVNNMMTIILGFSDLLSRELPAPDDRQREVDEIRKAAMRAAKITSQLLAFSRQQLLQPIDLRLNQVVQDMVPVLRLMLPANLTVEVALAPLDAVVRADRSQLEQVLINLAFNARDAMTSGGSIQIATETRYLDETAGMQLIGIPIPAGRYGLVSVADTGHGMDEATAAQAFEPFFTTKPVGRGTGLGLATVYGIVKQSGGYVWAESASSEGTTVTVCLPEVGGKTADSMEDEGGRTSLPEASGGTVMILEDEPGVRELAARILRERGYRVLEAESGAAALAALRNGSPRADLLLTDVVVPDIGVVDLEREVHHLLPGLPILYMSGYPRDDILDRGLLRSEQPFIQKPFSTEQLVMEVGRMISGP